MPPEMISYIDVKTAWNAGCDQKPGVKLSTARRTSSPPALIAGAVDGDLYLDLVSGTVYVLGPIRVVDLPAINLASTEPDLPSGGPQDPADEGPA